MTLEPPRFDTGPGPVGLEPRPFPNLPRGPIGVLHVDGDESGAKGATTQSTKTRKKARTLDMPPAAGDNKTKLARSVSWKLDDGKAPAIGDVKQGELRNCPLASLLGALAFTGDGRKHIGKMISEVQEAVVTDLTAVKDALDEGQTEFLIAGNRYFVVTLSGKDWQVSDVLYTDDADRGWDPIYMRSPTSFLWPCIVEKAYAKMEGGYSGLDSLFGKGLTLNAIWKAVTGTDPSGFEVTDKTSDRDLIAAARAAPKRPTVAASKLKLATQSGATRWHGFVVKGLAGNRIEVHDPAKVKSLKISFNEFRDDFLAVLYQDM